MSIEFKCPKCKREYSVNEKYAGKRLKCKNENCGTMMQVPEIVKSQGSKVCPSCNAKMTKKSVVCVKCGLDIKTGQILQAFQKQPKEKNRNFASLLNKKHIIVAGFSIAVICLVIAIAAFSGNDNNEPSKTIATEPKSHKQKENSSNDVVKPEKSQKQNEDEKYYLKVRNGSLEDWKDFLKKYPDSIFVDEIKLLIHKREQRIERDAKNAEIEEQILEKALYEKTINGDIEACSKFLKKYPKSKYYDEINELMNQRVNEFNSYKKADTIEACVSFLNRYKSSKYEAEIEKRILDMLESIYDYEDFIAKYPELHVSDVMKSTIQKIRKKLEEDDEKLAQKMSTDEVKEYVGKMARHNLVPDDETIKKMLNEVLVKNRKIVKAMRKLIDYHDRVSYKCTGDDKLAHDIALDYALQNDDYFRYKALNDGFKDDESVKEYYEIYLRKAKAVIEAQRRVDELNK